MSYSVVTLENGKEFRDTFETLEERDAFVESIKKEYADYILTDYEKDICKGICEVPFKNLIFSKSEDLSDIVCMIMYNDEDEKILVDMLQKVKVRKPATLEVKIPYLWRK